MKLPSWFIADATYTVVFDQDRDRFRVVCVEDGETHFWFCDRYRAELCAARLNKGDRE